jgi:hypothetical protein
MGRTHCRCSHTRPERRFCLVIYRKRLKTPTKVEAAEFADVIEVEIENINNGVTLNFRAPAKAPWSGTGNSGKLDVEVIIPDSCSVIFNTSYFDIEGVGPFTELIVTESLSRVYIETVRGFLDVNVSNRPVFVKDIRGKLSVVNKYDQIKMENVDTGGELATIRNENGEINIQTFVGSLDLKTSYDQVVAQNLFLYGTKNRIKCVSAPLMLSFDSLTVGRLRINNQYGQISMRINGRTDARFICRIDEKGKVIAEHMDLIPGLIQDTRLEFVTGDETAEVRLTTKGGGDIIIDGPNENRSSGGI